MQRRRDYPRIISAEIDFGPEHGGNYHFRNGGIGGKPFPSEAEASAFDEGLKVMNKFMFMPYAEQRELLKQLEL